MSELPRCRRLFYPGSRYYYDGVAATIVNTTIAGNSALSGPDCSGEFTSLGHNLVGEAIGCGFEATGGDQVEADSHRAGRILAHGYFQPSATGDATGGAAGSRYRAYTPVVPGQRDNRGGNSQIALPQPP